MLARPFRVLALAVTAFSLVVLRLTCPSAIQGAETRDAAAHSASPDGERVVFRHYL